MKPWKLMLMAVLLSTITLPKVLPQEGTMSPLPLTALASVATAMHMVKKTKDLYQNQVKLFVNYQQELEKWNQFLGRTKKRKDKTENEAKKKLKIVDLTTKD